jgi:hypothetical protein
MLCRTPVPNRDSPHAAPLAMMHAPVTAAWILHAADGRANAWPGDGAVHRHRRLICGSPAKTADRGGELETSKVIQTRVEKGRLHARCRRR